MVMNEQIRELINEATCFKEGDTEGKYDIEVFDKEKFAELIVKECMNVLDPGEHQLIARFQARKWLAEHFGVEE
jgi:hypothetical protein